MVRNMFINFGAITDDLVRYVLYI